MSPDTAESVQTLLCSIQRRVHHSDGCFSHHPCHIRTTSTSSSQACTGYCRTLVEKGSRIALFADGTFGAVDKRKITRPDGSICYVAVKRLKKHNTSEKVCTHARTCCSWRTDARA